MRAKQSIRDLAKTGAAGAHKVQKILRTRLVETAGLRPDETVWYAEPRSEREGNLSSRCTCSRKRNRVVPAYDVSDDRELLALVAKSNGGTSTNDVSAKYHPEASNPEPQTPVRPGIPTKSRSSRAMALFSPMSKHRAADTGMIDEWRSQIEEIVTKGGNEDAVGTDEPKRNTAVWLMMGAGRRKGQWRKMYPLRMGEDDEWFEAMETRNHEIARKVRVKLIPFELILQLKEDKGEKMTTLGSSVRQACTSFMHDIVEQPRTLGAFAAFYSALLCAVSVVAMLAPGGVSLAIAWGVVGCASVGGYLVVRRRHFTSSDASDDARSGGVNSTADIIWANFSVIKGIWASLLLLVLAPTTLMTLPDSVTASIHGR